MLRKKLTLRIVEGAPVGEVDAFIWDSVVKGFAVRIQPGGTRTFLVQYRFAGQSRRYKIGLYGSPWTVETARSKALWVLGQVADGVDPQAEKFAARKAMTVAELCDLYLREGMATCKDSSIESARSDIDNHIKPLLGPKTAAAVTREDVDKLLLAVAEGKTAKRMKTRTRGLSRVRGGKGAANSSVVTLSAAFAFGVSRGVRTDNPAWRVRRFRERKLARFLSPAELGRLGEAIAVAESLGVENRYALAAIRLLILTGCRKNEILTAKHAYLDSFHRCLRLPDSKTGEKSVHLGAAALKIIQDLEPVDGNPYLLPGPGGAGRLINLQKPWDRIRTAAGLKDVRIHDLRHSFASLGVASGDSLYVVGALLGHRSPKTTARYAHLADHPVKKAADRIAQEAALLIGAEMPDLPVDDVATRERAARDAAAQERAASILGEVRRARWMDTPAAAAFLGNTVGTLQTWRWMGVGPVFRKIGRRVVYAQSDLEAWARREGLALPPPAPAPVPTPAPKPTEVAQPNVAQSCEPLQVKWG
ncbi:tyrosine-type recombinase/integrase [Phenylobacterium sp. J367]|uniref:tyrosine-type recombinase/integrase n=1 Tax=Phenylobacterium sp. J367 TaxID=2898435 RepID=UPI002150E2ED|nr:tyrosine-type recombinase/integrase [Phenylobacterium sp. J367]MCR5879438.1 tyrosine-type recombinase/integrase [Phenylobacterium sp. J367]